MASIAQYKKTYEGDYSKSYRDHVAWKKEGADKKRIYDEISKKVGTKYNKSERSDYYNITGGLLKDSERVFADGSKYKKEDKGKVKRNWEESYHQVDKKQDQQKKQTEAKEEEVKSSSQVRTIDDIVKDLKESAYQNQAREDHPPVKVNPIEIEDDGNYNYIDYPIQQTGIGSYKNLKTGKTLNTEEARNILRIAGFSPKNKASLGSVLFAFIIMNIIFSSTAPFLIAIAAIIYGVFRFTMTSTTWLKTTAKKTFQFNMEATVEDIAFNRKVGIASFIIGILIILYHY